MPNIYTRGKSQSLQKLFSTLYRLTALLSHVVFALFARITSQRERWRSIVISSVCLSVRQDISGTMHTCYLFCAWPRIAAKKRWIFGVTCSAPYTHSTVTTPYRNGSYCRCIPRNISVRATHRCRKDRKRTNKYKLEQKSWKTTASIQITVLFCRYSEK